MPSSGVRPRAHVFSAGLTACILAASPPAAAGRAEDESRWRFEPFPEINPYREGVASPHRLTSSVELVHVDSGEIPDAGDLRTMLRLGGRFGLLALHRAGEPERRFQLGLDAGLSALFDDDANQDNIGWEGKFGVTLSAAQGPAVAWKVGILHTSSHVGDEYILTASRGRLGYSREEALAGLSLRTSPRTLIDVESGYGFGRRLEVQRPWRARIGLVWEDPDRFASGRFGWYSAADLSSWQERDWRVDRAVQAGLIFVARERTWRLGLAIQDGRPDLGEFFQETETTISVGLWLDFGRGSPVNDAPGSRVSSGSAARPRSP